MCASLCTADELCNAYRFDTTFGCILGSATQLVGANPRSNITIDVYINAILVPGMMSSLLFKDELQSLLQMSNYHSFIMGYSL